MQLHYLTGSTFKVESARMALTGYDVEVVPVSVHIPEIQADINLEIARYAAEEARKLLGVPIVREDHGFFLDAFPGFPGPYMAYVEGILDPEAILKLLENKVRTGYFEMALSYSALDGKLIEFVSRISCEIAQKQHGGDKDYGWDSIIQVAGDSRTISEYAQEERYQFFTENFQKLAQALELKKVA